MDENITAVTVMTVQKSIFSSSLLYSMVIFTDPAYILIAGMGAFVSMGSAHYDLVKLRKAREDSGLKCEKSAFMELSKAFVTGAILTVLSFMLLHQAGGEAMESLTGVKWFDKMLPSFWLILTVAIATESVTIWDRIKEKIARRFK